MASDHGAELDHSFCYPDLAQHTFFGGSTSARGVEEDLGGFACILFCVFIVVFGGGGVGRAMLRGLQGGAKDGQVGQRGGLEGCIGGRGGGSGGGVAGGGASKGGERGEEGHPSHLSGRGGVLKDYVISEAESGGQGSARTELRGPRIAVVYGRIVNALLLIILKVIVGRRKLQELEVLVLKWRETRPKRRTHLPHPQRPFRTLKPFLDP